MTEIVPQEEGQLVPMDQVEDDSTRAVIELPGYDDVSDQKVMRSMQDVFKGFSGSSLVRLEDIKDSEKLASYAKTTMDDIRDVYRKSEAAALSGHAAAMARFWCLGKTIDQSLTSSKRGSAAVYELAAGLHKSTPYIYQIRSVSTRLSLVDCYLLGIRGLDSTHLRRLAQVRDDKLRSFLVHTFVESVKDNSDESVRVSAKKQLIAAINSTSGSNLLEQATSDPLNGGSDVKVSEEYTSMWSELRKLQGCLRKLADEKTIERFCSAADDFYIMSGYPDAQDKLDDFLELVSETKSTLAAAQEKLQDYSTQLDSLELTELTESDA